MLWDLNPDARGSGWGPTYGVDAGGCGCGGRCGWGRGDSGETFDVPPDVTTRMVKAPQSKPSDPTEEQSDPPRGGGGSGGASDGGGSSSGDLAGAPSTAGDSDEDASAIQAVLDALEDLWGELAGGGSGESPGGSAPGTGGRAPVAPPVDLAPPGTDVALPPGVTLPLGPTSPSDDGFVADEGILVVAVPIAELIAVGVGIGVGVGVGIIVEDVIDWIAGYSYEDCQAKWMDCVQYTPREPCGDCLRYCITNEDWPRHLCS